jgi:hypothetical protein
MLIQKYVPFYLLVEFLLAGHLFMKKRTNSHVPVAPS